MQRIHRPHSAQNHRSIEKRIQPFQLSQVVVTDHSNPQGQGKGKEREHHMASDTLCKIGSTEDRVLSMFVHTATFYNVTAQPAPGAVGYGENAGTKSNHT